MTIVRWDPFRDFGFSAPATWMPPVDIFQTSDHELVLKAELPDMERDNIDINIENFVLTIKGEKNASPEVKDEQYHHIERRYGAFQRTVALPTTVKADAIQASLNNGILRLDIPKAEEVKPRRINVSVSPEKQIEVGKK